MLDSQSSRAEKYKHFCHVCSILSTYILVKTTSQLSAFEEALVHKEGLLLQLLSMNTHAEDDVEARKCAFHDKLATDRTLYIFAFKMVGGLN